jgi:hypothetical protein
MRNNKSYNWGNDITFNNTGPMGTVVLEGNELHETTTGSPVLALLATSLPSIQSSRNRMSCSFLSSGQTCANLWRVGVNTVGQFYTRVADSTSVEAAPQFADPDRNLATYYRKIRGSTAGLQGFIDEAKMQGEGGWKCELMAEEINEYIRGGFVPVDPSIIVIRK